MTTLYLVRHGETIDNAAQILQGHLQGELNERGILQAETTRDKLKGEPIDVFVSSDLKRSVDTKTSIKPFKVFIFINQWEKYRKWIMLRSEFISYDVLK